MLRVDDPPDWLVRGREAKFPAGGILGVVAASVGMVWAPFAFDWVLGAAAFGGLAASGWLWSVRRQVDSMPLELSTEGLMDHVRGERVVLVRGWLGAGRCVRLTQIHASIRTSSGSGVPVEVCVPSGPRVGPWIVMVPLGHHQSGDLALSVTVQAGPQVFEASRMYALENLREGRFASPIRASSGPMAWNRGSWNRIETAMVGEDTA